MTFQVLLLLLRLLSRAERCICLLEAGWGCQRDDLPGAALASVLIVRSWAVYFSISRLLEAGWGCQEMTFQVRLLLLCSLSGAEQCIRLFLDCWAEVVKVMTFQVQLLLLCSSSGAEQCICPFLDTPGGRLRLSKRWPSRCSCCYCAHCQERSHVFVHVYRQGEVTSSETFCSFYACS